MFLFFVLGWVETAVLLDRSISGGGGGGVSVSCETKINISNETKQLELHFF
jgi:hypothetical protein